ncbi:hypothetical protein HanXRQr2_Chr13g0603591 [Helianthus annuus]|uniref:Uncharacterized protein n=1 Tax=Helianthus annuus TaxID=4232 RepID=A0A251SV02_HELAN|nr:hypothetical protein HanXRQr2_Chr13g0603591 [Helianthus annuus]KAJ0850504.1 hypothetical protein HanPSC8_Chr13g0581631 [Helianthus annuus]
MFIAKNKNLLSTTIVLQKVKQPTTLSFKPNHNFRSPQTITTNHWLNQNKTSSPYFSLSSPPTIHTTTACHNLLHKKWVTGKLVVA